uniref:Amino acid transporter n=1 Tax=Colletotrichum fructicola (strain Nara gc5) TaxID=1213859 RepID=L2FPH2_COLFN
MIGFCSGIGTGLFIGTGSAYANAGPAGLLLAYIVVGAVLWCVMQSIGELATLIPTAGSFPHWATRFIDPSVGFSLAISYGYCYNTALASEGAPPSAGTARPRSPAAPSRCCASSASSSPPSSSPPAAGPTTRPSAFPHNPGAWVDYNGISGSTGHFLGFVAAFINASFSFIGIETVVVTAAESVNPHKAIPNAARRVTMRIGFFYIFGALLIGLIVDPREPGLVSGSGNANSSPWVIAIRQAGINILPSIVNACILVSAWSAGNSYCWVGSRMIVAMTTDRQLPQIFGVTNKQGVPYVAVITAWLFGPLAYLSLGSGGAADAFNWLLSLSTIAGLIAWATLCFCYIRFHRAMKVQGVSRDTLPWKAPFQPYAAWFGFVGSTVITFVAGFSVFLKGNWSTADFVSSYIGIPIFIVPIIGWKLYHRTKFVRAHEIDLWSGRLHESEYVPEKPKPENFRERVSQWFS